MNQLYKLEEFSIDDFRKYISAKTKFYRKERKSVKGNEPKIAKILDFDFDKNILTIQTDPTYDFRAWNLNDGATGQVGEDPKSYASKQGRYLIKIEIVDLEKWKDSPWLEMKLPEFKEILRLADIRLNCTCMAFYWQGHRYELSQLDSAIYPYSGADSGKWRNNKDGFNGHNKQAGLCKHLAAVMPMLNFQAPAILKAIRESAKKKKLVEKTETFKAPSEVAKQAQKALDAKEKFGDKVKGGTQVGWTRANQLANRENLSYDTVKRMTSFFARHEGNQSVESGKEWYEDAGKVAWLLWGGNPGKEWANKIVRDKEKD